jgi:hypothetical protein
VQQIGFAVPVGGLRAIMGGMAMIEGARSSGRGC